MSARVALIKGGLLAESSPMAVKKSKKEGSGIQQAAGLIRYFDEESEHAWHITPLQIYIACIGLGGFFYLANHGVVGWIIDMF